MNLTTITYDADKWQLVPKNLTHEMYMALRSNYGLSSQERWENVLYVAPQPETLSPWQPIETAPKDGEQFYVTGYNYGVVGAEMWYDVAFRNNKGGITSATTHDFLQFAAYWMPLPAPPKPEQGK